MTLFYLLFLIFIVLLLAGGYDATMRLIAFIDLNTRYAFLNFRLWMFKKKIERELEKDRKEFKSQQEKIMSDKEFSDFRLERKQCEKCEAVWLNGKHVWATGASSENSEDDLAGLVCNKLGDHRCINPKRGSDTGDTWEKRAGFIEGMIKAFAQGKMLLCAQMKKDIDI